MTPLVTGLSFPTFVEFNGNTAYVSNWSVTAMGEIVKIENFSSVQPPPPMPTAAPTQASAATATPLAGVIGAPDTGDGSGASGASSAPMLLLGALGAVLILAGARFAWKRDA